jgi:hypothetical protein
MYIEYGCTSRDGTSGLNICGRTKRGAPLPAARSGLAVLNPLKRSILLECNDATAKSR